MAACSGSIANQLDVPLTDCVLFCTATLGLPAGNAARRGKRANIDQDDSNAKPETYLTKRRIVSSKDEAVGYDRASFDVGRIVEVMMFHDGPAVNNYTGCSTAIRTLSI